MIIKEIINTNGNVYTVKLKKPIEYLQDPNNGVVRMDWVDSWLGFLGCDMVLSTQTHLLFLNSIEEAEIVI